MKTQNEKKLHRSRVNLGTAQNPVIRWVSGWTLEEVAEAKEKMRQQSQAANSMPASNRRQAKNRGILFIDYAEQWYALYKHPHIRPSTDRHYRSLLKNYLYPAFRDMGLAQITRADTQRLLNAMAGKSKSGIKKCRLLMVEIFDSAVDDDLIIKNPAKRLRLPKGTEKVVLPMDSSKIGPMTAHCLADPDGLLPLMLLYTGMRRGEALALRWRDIGENEITVNGSLTFQGNAGVIGPTKTAAGHRSVPLLPPLREKLGERGEPDALLFGGDTPWTSTKLKRTWERIQKTIPELAHINPHQLRHTYTDMLRHAGVDPKTAQYFLGHEDYSTTANVYSRVDERDTSRGAAQMLSFLSPETQAK